LTGNELKNYQSFTAKKSDNPNIVRNMLLDQADNAEAIALGRTKALRDSGYKVPEIRPRSFLGTYSGESSGVDIQTERKNAQSAIDAGADANQVRARYKQKTGQEF
jgi:hypothetical protein